MNQKAPTLAVDNNRRSASIKLNPVGLEKEFAVKASQEGGTSSAEVIDYLDVPTFMRKQVD